MVKTYLVYILDQKTKNHKRIFFSSFLLIQNVTYVTFYKKNVFLKESAFHQIFVLYKYQYIDLFQDQIYDTGILTVIRDLEDDRYIFCVRIQPRTSVMTK